MLSNENFLHDPKTWISALALVVSVFSAIFSWRSQRNSTRALAISESQEKRRQPQLAIYLAKAYRRRVARGQLFGFLVSVSNPTDINNSIARVEIQITYRLRDDAETTCRIPHSATLAGGVSDNTRDSPNVFSLPTRIDAHQTVTGWLLFALRDDIIGKGSVDSHRLILEDAHGVSTISDQIMVREWTHEVEKE